MQAEYEKAIREKEMEKRMNKNGELQLGVQNN